MNNDTVHEPSSFRDPSGFVFKKDGQLLRHIAGSYKQNYDMLMCTGLYQVLVDSKLLIPHVEIDHDTAAYKVLKPSLVPFISYPYEWCFSQLKQAALTTLNIQKLALEHGMTLKDASAFNIQFFEGCAVLIDTLSFAAYQDGDPWFGYRQFCQHFLAPLALMAYSDIRLNKLLSTHIDGVPLDLAVRMLPMKAKLNPKLIVHLFMHASEQKKYSRPTSPEASTFKMPKEVLMALIEDLESSIAGLKLKVGQPTEWSDYYNNTNYSLEAVNSKEALVDKHLRALRPKVVWDLGANVGNYSRIAAASGAYVISMDVDPVCVESNYLHCVSTGNRSILPLLINLTAPTPRVGWANQERMSLGDRGPADVLLVLALIHHMAISNNVPLDLISRYMHQLGNILIIEFVPKNDSQVQRLLQFRQDIFPEYTQAGFEIAFTKWFHIESRESVEDSERLLYVMRRKDNAGL